MMRSLIYLHSEFWANLCTDKSVEGIRACLNVYDALKEADISTDVDISELQENLSKEDDSFPFNRFLFQIFKDRFAGKGGYIDFDYSIEPKDDSIKQLTAIHLHETTLESSADLSDKWGILVFNSDQISRKKELFKGSGILLQKGAFYKERFKRYAPQLYVPCNTMIIIDPYVLAKPNNIINSLIPWFDTVLPSGHLAVVFQITILSMIADRRGNQLFGSDIKIIHDKLYALIQEKRNRLNFTLSIFAISKGEDFHSRNIITNNVLIQAPDGIGVYKDNGTANKNASFNMVIPRLYGDDRRDLTTYFNWIKLAKKQCENASESTFYGSRYNRLFDLV